MKTLDRILEDYDRKPLCWGTAKCKIFN